MFKNPLSLYDICISVAVADCINVCKFCKKEFRNLPDNVLFDFYHKMFMEKRLCMLAVEFGQLEVFNRLLSVRHQRPKLLKCYQSLIEHGPNVPELLIKSYSKYLNAPTVSTNDIDLGLRIGAFFKEGGWYNYSIEMLNLTEQLCKRSGQDTLMKLLDCYHKKLHSEAIYCCFEEAQKTIKAAEEVVEQLEKRNELPNLASLYSTFSILYFMRSEYNEAFYWSEKALSLLASNLPIRTIVDVLRQASKSCVVKRRFRQAGFLIDQAMSLAEQLYSEDNHPCFSNTLLDYGFYLLNFDSIQESVKAFERALAIRKEVFDKNNILVALAHEDVAYALYVQEYSSGRFYFARENAEKSIRIMKRILPPDHILLSSVKRVKALILEEIALDLREPHNSDLKDQYLSESEQLHKDALALSFKEFGEKNVQTAKHYGNLGRLYQSMKQFEEAERMHLKAIAIKKELLGEGDYEVALSLGHLASLYNYHMLRYKDAESLYIQSINITLNMFGEAYTGLDYDYRGLVHVYMKLLDTTNMLHYTNKLRDWSKLREKISPIVHQKEILPLERVIARYFSLC